MFKGYQELKDAKKLLLKYKVMELKTYPRFIHIYRTGARELKQELRMIGLRGHQEVRENGGRG